MARAMAFADTLRKLNSMKEEGIVQEYAIAGAMAILFWTEPVLTYDLDVLVFLPEEKGPLVSLDAIYRWAEAHGYPLEDKHVLVEGVPTREGLRGRDGACGRARVPDRALPSTGGANAQDTRAGRRPKGPAQLEPWPAG